MTREQFSNLFLHSWLSQTELAKALGVAQSNVAAWLNGSRPVPQKYAEKIHSVCVETPRTPRNNKLFRDEITNLRCALSDIEASAKTLVDAREIARKALASTDQWHSQAGVAHLPDIAGLTGQQLKWLRNACELSQGDLASAIGIRQSNISAWEAGRESIPPHHIPTIRAAIGNAAKTMTLSMPAMLAVIQSSIGSADSLIDSMSAEEFSQLRREAGLSQRQIAAALDTSQAVVWRWEKVGVSRRKAADVRRVFTEHQAAPTERLDSQLRTD